MADQKGGIIIADGRGGAQLIYKFGKFSIGLERQKFCPRLFAGFMFLEEPGGQSVGQNELPARSLHLPGHFYRPRRADRHSIDEERDYEVTPK